MVKEGQYDQMKQFLEEVDPQHLVKENKATSTHIGSIVRCLAAESKDPEGVREFVEFLLEKKFVLNSMSELNHVILFLNFFVMIYIFYVIINARLTPGQKQALYGFVVEAHLEKGDREAAVAEFEEIHKTLNICSYRRNLLCALIKVRTVN